MSERKRDADVIEGQFRVSTDPQAQPLARQVEEHVVIVEKRVPVPVRVEVPVERIVYRERPVIAPPNAAKAPPARRGVPARHTMAEGDPLIGVGVALAAMLLMVLMASCGAH